MAHGSTASLPDRAMRPDQNKTLQAEIAHLDDLLRHVVRTRVLADPPPQTVAEPVVQRQPVPQAHEQHDAHVALPVLPHDQALHDLRQLLHLPVDLRRADAHAAGIERGVAPPVDHQAVVRGELGPVAVAPDAGEEIEVRRPVLGCFHRLDPSLWVHFF